MVARKQWLFVCGVLWSVGFLLGAQESASQKTMTIQVGLDNSGASDWFCEYIKGTAHDYALFVVEASAHWISKDGRWDIKYHARNVERCAALLAKTCKDIDSCRCLEGTPEQVKEQGRVLKKEIWQATRRMRSAIAGIMNIFSSGYGVFLQAQGGAYISARNDFKRVFDYQDNFLSYISSVEKHMDRNVDVLRCAAGDALRSPGTVVDFEFVLPQIVLSSKGYGASVADTHMLCHKPYRVCDRLITSKVTKGRVVVS